MAANPGRNSGKPRAPMSWQATVGALIKQGAIVHAYCNKCELWQRADLQRIAEAKGEAYSLWDRSTACTTPGCAGRIWFHASPGQGTPSRPLKG